jgi:YidC/Oxa1 family membrane protein insertase
MSKNTINTIIGVVLIIVIFIGFTILTAPSKEEKEKARKYHDSLLSIQEKKYKEDSARQANPKVNDSIKKDSLVNNAGTVKSTDSVAKQENKDNTGVFSLSSDGVAKKYIIENELIKLKISSRGGGISYIELKKYKTWDKKPLIVLNNDTSNISLIFFANNRNIKTNTLIFHPFWTDQKFNGKDSMSIGKDGNLAFSMRLYPNNADSTLNKSKYVEFAYTLKGDNYMMDFTINMINMNDVIAANTNNISLEWNLDAQQLEKSRKNEMMTTTVYFKPKDDDVDYLSETKDDEKSFNAQIKWVSFTQQFFSSTIIANTSFSEAKLKSIQGTDSSIYLKKLFASLALPYNSSNKQSYSMLMYNGPNQYNTLRDYKLDLERQIPLGWGFFLLQWINRFAVIPVFNFLDSFGINYGIIILLLTIILKIILLPIAYKTYMSSAKMRILKPEIDEITQKFPKKEDAMKKQQATMALYKKAGVNPMAGCIPLLLQMPILIALYRFFPASIELRQQSFLWATDLSTYDSIYSWTEQIPLLSTFYGNHISLFTLLMTISTIIYTRQNNQMMGSTNQMPGMKVMMYLMPVMFLGFFNNFAAGLSYYYLLANLLTFAQMYLFRKFVNEDKLHARIQENKKKIVKKSGWQKRLEDMAKTRGYQPAKKK